MARTAGIVKVLAFDCALEGCTVALWQDGRVLAHRADPSPRGQAATLVPLLRAVMAEDGGGWASLDRLAVTVGPGSFTGLRIGLAAARGIVLATAIPVAAVTTLEAVAHGLPAPIPPDARLAVAIASGRADLYSQLFGADLMPLGEPSAALPAEIAAAMRAAGRRWLVAGNAAAEVLAAVAAAGLDALAAEGPALPDAAVVARLGAGRAAGPPPAPLYLRAPSVTQALGRRS
jgi:tRNA threonylcarbamoyladenosine biosynthesis protein TsaB